MAAQNSTYAYGWVRGPIRIAQPFSNVVPIRPHADVEWSEITPASTSLSLKTRQKASLSLAFHYFSKLPPELRIKVWVLAAPSQRVVEIRSWGDSTRNPYTPVKFSVGPHRPPSILHVNQESRQEALRVYKLVKIGVSAAVLNPNRAYVPWKYHPVNPNSVPNFTAVTYPLPNAWPYDPRQIYLDFNRDIVYLGPEFHVNHLKSFLTAMGPGLELPGLQYLAMDRKSWLNGRRWPGTRIPQHESLRLALYALQCRPLKEIYIIPDDAHDPLKDKYYYGKHEIQFQEPTFTYTFRPSRLDHVAKTAAESLEEWFVKLWGEKGLLPPKVAIKSVRRNRSMMGYYKDGVEEIQKTFGNMSAWRSWSPPADS